MKNGRQKRQGFLIDLNHFAKSVSCPSPVILLLVGTLIVSCTSVSTHSFQNINKNSNRNTQLAQFQLSAYLMSDGTRLRVNVDKQVGGKVTIQFVDSEGAEYYQLALYPQDTRTRFNLNLAELNDGDYVLKVSNGLEMELRKIKIATSKPTAPIRQVSLL